MTDSTTFEGTDDMAHSNAYEPWSPTVRARREAMLPSLKDAVVREGRRRQRRRIAARGAATIALFLAVSVPLLTYRSEPSRQIVDTTSSDVPPHANPFRRVSILQSRPGAVQRLALTTSVDPTSYTVDDRELVRTLAAIGRPAGLIRLADGVRLTDPVTDLELTPPATVATAEHRQKRNTP